jgi:hypothetical protein
MQLAVGRALSELHRAVGERHQGRAVSTVTNWIFVKTVVRFYSAHLEGIEDSLVRIQILANDNQLVH